MEVERLKLNFHSVKNKIMTNQKTNWKFILVVLILAILVH